jgi:hypothetical protein
MVKILSGIAVSALLAAAPAFAESASDKLDPKKSAQSAEQPSNSGPGVQGPPDTRTGPSTKGSESGSASEGAGSGEAGASSTENTTVPSQDSSGVEGLPGNKSGPSIKEPSDKMDGSSKK